MAFSASIVEMPRRKVVNVIKLLSSSLSVFKKKKECLIIKCFKASWVNARMTRILLYR